MPKPYKELTLKEKFNLKLEFAINRGNGFLILVTTPGVETSEVIINLNEALEEKRNYWNEVYDDNLIHKHNNEIKIVGYGHYSDELINILKMTLEVAK